MNTPTRELSSAVWAALACPGCGAALERTAAGARCAGCGAEYALAPGGALSLHPVRPTRVPLVIEVGGRPLGDADLAAVARQAPPARRAAPVEPPPGLTVGNRLTAGLTEYLPRGGDGLLLDVGCGSRSFEPFLREVTGLDYLGMDLADGRAHLLGDAHALPFADGSAALVTSFAVLEHVAQPWLMAREVRRVLRPGGRFVGTVAFLEPYHEASHAHLSPLGTLAVLRQAGLDVELLEPSREWTGLRAIVAMTSLPARLWRLAEVLAAPLEALQRLAAWGRRRRSGRDDVLADWRAAGGFRFVAARPLEPGV